MPILLWITIEMEYKIKCLKFILFFTNGRQKLTAKGLRVINHIPCQISNNPSTVELYFAMNVQGLNGQ